MVGILNAKDYFRLDGKSREEVMAIVRPPFFVPETIRADILFRKMKKNRSPMAVVLDEYGGMVGIITMNDLIEELVGDLGEESEELEKAEPHIRKLSGDTWAVYGNVELWELEDALNLHFNQDEVDTFTGLVFSELDMIPDDGEQNIRLELMGLVIDILDIREHQVTYAKISKTGTESEDSPEK